MVKAYRKTFNTRLIKTGMSYTIQDIEELFGVHKRTVQVWHKEGLKKIDAKKPYMFHSEDLRVFLNNRQQKRKNKCKPIEFYCFKCKQPRHSKEDEIQIDIRNQKSINLVGVCAVCGGRMNKINSLINIEKVKKTFVVIEIHNKHIIACDVSLDSTDKKE